MTFPLDPYNDQIFPRSSHKIPCFYHVPISAWLTLQMFETTLYPLVPLPAGGAFELNQSACPQFLRYVVGASISMYVNGTNNGTNYWVATFRSGTSGASLASPVNTSTQAATTWVSQTVSVNASNSTDLLQVAMTKVGTPGAIYVVAVARYRLIVT